MLHVPIEKKDGVGGSKTLCVCVCVCISALPLSWVSQPTGPTVGLLRKCSQGVPTPHSLAAALFICKTPGLVHSTLHELTLDALLWGPQLYTPACGHPLIAPHCTLALSLLMPSCPLLFPSPLGPSRWRQDLEPSPSTVVSPPPPTAPAATGVQFCRESSQPQGMRAPISLPVSVYKLYRPFLKLT